MESELQKALETIERQKLIIANQEQIIKNDKGIIEVLNKMIDSYRVINRKYRDILEEEKVS